MSWAAHALPPEGANGKSFARSEPGEDWRAPWDQPAKKGLEAKLHRSVSIRRRKPKHSFDRLCREGYFFCYPCGVQGLPAVNYKHEGDVCPSCEHLMSFLDPIPEYAEAKARAEAQSQISKVSAV